MKQLAIRSIHPYYDAVRFDLIRFTMRFDAMEKYDHFIFWFRQTANHKLTYMSSDF